MVKEDKLDISNEINHDLIREVKEAEEELFIARDKLGYVLEDDLIDYYIYEVNALEKKYEYLLKKAKEIG